jgi:excisionase family DNA binding protein
MQKDLTQPQVYTVEEFAKMFKLSPEAVRSLIRKGEIPAIRIGRRYRIPQAIVDHYFAQATSPEERGFGLWKQKPVASLAYMNKQRDRDRRTPEAFLRDMAEDR